MSSRSVTENHALVAVPVALIIQAMAKMIAAMMASMPILLPIPRRDNRRSQAVLGGLQGVQLGVLAAQREQVGVLPLLDDLPVAQHVDPVRVLDAGQPVGDQQDAAVPSVPADGAEQGVLRPGV